MAECNSKGGEAFGGAASGSGGPVIGTIDWGESLAVPGVDGGAGVKMIAGDGWVPGVGGEVKGGALLAVSVEDGIGRGDEGASNGG